MRPIKIAGLCLVAVLALSAVVVASASANAQPEFWKCVKVAKNPSTKKYEGEYMNKTCTEKATGAQKAEGKKNKYELATAAATEFTAGKSKKTVLHAQGLGGKKEVITCKKDKSKGVFEETFIEGLTYTLEGCSNEAKKACESEGASAGTIETTDAALLEWLNAEGTEPGMATRPFGEFECNGEKFEVGGYLIGTVAETSKGVTATFKLNGGGEQEEKLVFPGGSEVGPLTLHTEYEEAEHEATVEGTEEFPLKGIKII